MEISGPTRGQWSGKMINSYKQFNKKCGQNYKINSLNRFFQILVASESEPIFLLILVLCLLLLLPPPPTSPSPSLPCPPPSSFTFEKHRSLHYACTR